MPFRRRGEYSRRVSTPPHPPHEFTFIRHSILKSVATQCGHPPVSTLEELMNHIFGTRNSALPVSKLRAHSPSQTRSSDAGSRSEILASDFSVRGFSEHRRYNQPCSTFHRATFLGRRQCSRPMRPDAVIGVAVHIARLHLWKHVLRVSRVRLLNRPTASVHREIQTSEFSEQ